MPEFQDKIFAIGPSFGISLWSWSKLALYCLKNYRKSKGYYNIGIKRWVSDYVYTNIRRQKFVRYGHSDSDKDYCFHISTLWYDPLSDRTTNYFRGYFLKAAKKIFPTLDGGFYYIPSPSVVNEYPPYVKYIEEFKEYITTKRISPKTYIHNTKKTAIVFNTPSVGGCHGWKLAEYLSMGKAIISTPLTNEMPGEFVPGVHYHLVENENDIEDAIKLLHENNDYRLKLEKGAFQYFHDFLSPEKVIQRIIEQVGK